MKNSALAISTLVLMISCGFAHAQQANGTGLASSSAEVGASAQTGDIIFEGNRPVRHQKVDTTPNVYVAPSMFGGSSENCGNSDSIAGSFTGFGFGVSKSDESIQCNDRRDTSTAWNLGFQDVARMRFFCFGQDVNRMAYEASGYVCPSSATAKGIEGVPVGPKFFAGDYVGKTLRMRINQDGSVTEVTY